MHRFVFLDLLALLAISGSLGIPAARAADPPAAEGIKSFQINPDFQIELVATEPVVTGPVDLKFDEHGAAYVIEMEGYPIAPDDPEKFPGKVVRLEDTNGDGIYDKRTVFADKLRYGCSILPYRGGLLAASTPDILFLKDTDGDGKADVREVVLTGFAVGNPQHNFNNLTHGLDNMIYGANGGNSGAPYWPDKPDKKFNIRWRDFRFDPQAKKFEAYSATTGGFGYTFDDYGRSFLTHNTDHISMVFFPMRYLEKNPYLTGTATVGEISDHGKGAEGRIYPIGPQATRMNHPEQSGYFSGSCGITAYTGGAFGEKYNGNVFVCDVVVNLLHRDVLRADGPVMLAGRGPGEDRSEFLASFDRAFRPVNCSIGPDGALYLLDFHRDVIEHPEWIPKDIQKDFDVWAGVDKGRIYRITPKAGLPRIAPIAIDRKNLKETAALLAKPNKWWRDTAQRLLVELGDKSAVKPLEDLFHSTPAPVGRLHAMWTLQGLGELKDEVIAAGLKDAEAGVRENALKLAEDRLAKSPELFKGTLALAHDPDARVRMQAALSFGIVDLEKNPKIAGAIHAARLEIARHDLEQEWTRKALLGGAGQEPMGLLKGLLADEKLGKDSPSLDAMTRSLASIVAARSRAGEIEETVRSAQKLASGHETLAASILEGLGDGFKNHDSDKDSTEFKRAITKALEPLAASPSLKLKRGAWGVQQALGLPAGESRKKALAEAAATATDEKADPAKRLESLSLIEFEDFKDRADLLFSLLSIRNPREVQLAAMNQISRARDESIVPRLLKMWNSLSPEVRGPAGNMLIWRPANHDLTLTALEKGDILIGQLDLNLEQRRAFLHSKNDNIRTRAEKLFNDFEVVTRRDAIEKMKPALKLKGEPKHGHEEFQNLCMKCHRILGEGQEVAPNLTEISRKSAETLMGDILDPNAAVNTQYISTTIETKAGDVVNGIISAETESSVTLREAEMKETVIPRTEIKAMHATGLSLMPEELEKGMSPQDMADLLAFLTEPK